MLSPYQLSQFLVRPSPSSSNRTATMLDRRLAAPHCHESCLEGSELPQRPDCADLPYWPQEPSRLLPVFPTSGSGAREEPSDDLATTMTTTFTRKKMAVGGRRSYIRETTMYLHGLSVLRGTEGLQTHMLHGHGRVVLHLHYIFPSVFTKSSRQKSWEDIPEIICIQVCLHKPWSIFYMTLTTCNITPLVAKEIFGFSGDTCLN